MKRLLVTAALLAATVGFASADPDYDRDIAAAAAGIVARNIGTIRPGFSYDEMPEFVVPIDWRPHAWSGPAYAI